LKRLMFFGLSVFLMCAGLITINCKSESKEEKASVKLNDSLFVEIVVQQGELLQKYQLRGQQAKTDSARQLILDEIKAETEKMLSDYGISEEQLKTYVKEIESDSARVKMLRGHIIERTKEMIMKKSQDVKESAETEENPDTAEGAEEDSE
jgi:hypothetical protein